MEDTLHDSVSRLQMALDGMGMGVWDWSVETGKVWFSDTWQTMLGYTPGEVEPHVSTWQNAVHPDDWPIINAALDPHLAGKTPRYECEHRVRCKDGSWLWILDRGKVVQRTEDGRSLRMVGTHDNIQARKEEESHRAALMELSRALVELDKVSHIVDRTLGTLLETLDVVSAAYTEMDEERGPPQTVRRMREGHIGMSQGRWVGGRLYREFGRRAVKGEVVTWPDIAKEAFMADVKPDDPSEWPTVAALLGVPIMRHDWLVGTLLVANKAPRTWTEREIAFLSDVRDRMREAIARAKAGEASRQAQEELQRIGRMNAFAALASTLAHELNQPLAAANNYLTAARLQVQRAYNGGAGFLDNPGNAIELAALQVVKAGEIIRQMRTLTNAGEGLARPASITRAVDEAIETVLGSMAPRVLVLHKFYAPDVPDVRIDVDQFQLAVGNLLRNAIEAMDGQENSEIEIAIFPTSDQVAIEICDTGPGLPEEMLKTLFRPFRSQKRRGMGLGLPVCRTIIEAHGGNLTGEQRADGGACFRIFLPVDRP